MSRVRSFLKGVIGKAITPESLLRSSVGSIMRQALTAEEAEVFAEVAEKKTDPLRPSAKASASPAVKRDVSQSHIHSLDPRSNSHRRDIVVRFELRILECSHYRLE